MKYYKVKGEFTNFIRPDGKRYAYEELYTEDEVKSGNLNTDYMEIVDYPESETYYYFNRRYRKNVYYAEYIDFYHCWRLYDPKYPEWTVAYLDSLDEDFNREDSIIFIADSEHFGTDL